MKVVTLDDKEFLALQTIIVDQNREDALRFLNDIIWERLKDKGPHPCGPRPV